MVRHALSFTRSFGSVLPSFSVLPGLGFLIGFLFAKMRILFPALSPFLAPWTCPGFTISSSRFRAAFTGVWMIPWDVASGRRRRVDIAVIQ